jgi:malate dehydrogenase
MTRADLIRVNGPVFVEQGKVIDAAVADHCQVVVVGNPANTNCLIAASQCKRIQPVQFTAMVRLDQNRAIAQLARKACAAVSDVSGVVIFGNHSATMYPCVEAATVGGRPVSAAIPDGGWLRSEFVTTVAKRGDAIIQARGLSSAASAAQALIDHVRSLTRPSGAVHSLAVVSHGEYGFAQGIWAALPVRTTAPGRWQVVPDLPISEFGKGKLAETNAELIRERYLALGYGFIA